MKHLQPINIATLLLSVFCLFLLHQNFHQPNSLPPKLTEASVLVLFLLLFSNLDSKAEPNKKE
ncbi:MAG: hypothetical protein ACPF8V_04530 [Luteibaculum sp.]